MNNTITTETRHRLTTLIIAWMAILGSLLANAQNMPGGPPMACTVDPNCPPVTQLAPFLDPLPIPTNAQPARTNANYCLSVVTNLCYQAVPEYDVVMTNVMHYFHTNLPPVEVFAYNGLYPGPTFQTVTNSPIVVNWINRLPAQYPAWLAANTSFHGVTDQSIRTVVHLHGGATLPRYDGYPTNWYTTGHSDQSFYGNIDIGTGGQTLWYHDHGIGVTANNVYAGLAGFYIVRNTALEQSLNLPGGKYEIPMVFQDRDIQTNCAPATLVFTNCPYHSLAVVNGKVTPFLEVEPRKYRFRILNGAGARTFGLNLRVTDTNGVPLTNKPPVKPPAFHVIGNDDGFLPQTSDLAATNGDSGLFLMPAERVDVIIDFTNFVGRSITVINLTGKADPPFAPSITNLMQFRVSLPLSAPDTSSIPGVIITNWVPTTNLVNQAVTNRTIDLDLVNESPFPGPPFNPNGSGVMALLNRMHFDDDITEMPHAGDTEVWTLVNLSNEAHPIHVHLVEFRVVDRVRFDGWNTNNDLAFPPTMVTNYINDRANMTLTNISHYLLQDPTQDFPASDFEAGPKDVVRAAPFSVTRIVMRWPTNALFYTTPSGSNLGSDTLGRYVYHCHILDHEDNDMMRPLQVLPPYQPALQTIRDAAVNPTGFNHFKLGLTTRLGETYGIESTSDLSPSGRWSSVLDNILGTGGLLSVTPPPATNQMLIYRVRRAPSP